jgi:hypothetical protein
VARSRVPLYTLGQDLSSPYRGDLREIRFATDPGRFRFPLCRADKGIHYADRGCPAITAQIPGVSPHDSAKSPIRAPPPHRARALRKRPEIGVAASKTANPGRAVRVPRPPGSKITPARPFGAGPFGARDGAAVHSSRA